MYFVDFFKKCDSFGLFDRCPGAFNDEINATELVFADSKVDKTARKVLYCLYLFSGLNICDILGFFNGKNCELVGQLYGWGTKDPLNKDRAKFGQKQHLFFFEMIRDNNGDCEKRANERLLELLNNSDAKAQMSAENVRKLVWAYERKTNEAVAASLYEFFFFEVIAVSAVPKVMMLNGDGAINFHAIHREWIAPICSSTNAGMTPDEFYDKLYQGPRRVFLRAPSGYGKSFFLAYFYTFLKLSTLKRHREEKDLETVLSTVNAAVVHVSLKNEDIRTSIWDIVKLDEMHGKLKDDPLFLLLDGYNEISEEQRRITRENIHDLNNSVIILTGWPTQETPEGYEEYSFDILPEDVANNVRTGKDDPQTKSTLPQLLRIPFYLSVYNDMPDNDRSFFNAVELLKAYFWEALPQKHNIKSTSVTILSKFILAECVKNPTFYKFTLDEFKQYAESQEKTDGINYEKTLNHFLEMNLIKLDNETAISSYQIRHDIIRDFFAAMAVVEEIKVLLRKKKRDEVCKLLANAFSLNVQKYIAEAIEPWKESGYYKELLDCFRMENLPESVRSCDVLAQSTSMLISILKQFEVYRSGFDGFDFSDMNLSKTALNRVCLRSCYFSGAIYTRNTFINEASHNSAVKGVLVSADGKTVVTVGNSDLHVWGQDKGSLHHQLGFSFPFVSVMWPDLSTPGRVIRIENHKESWRPAEDSDEITDTYGHYTVKTTLNDNKVNLGYIKIKDAETGKEKPDTDWGYPVCKGFRIRGMKFINEGKTIVAGSVNRNVYLIDNIDGTPVRRETIVGNNSGIRRMILLPSPYSFYLASSYDGSVLKLVPRTETVNGKERVTLCCEQRLQVGLQWPWALSFIERDKNGRDYVAVGCIGSTVFLKLDYEEPSKPMEIDNDKAVECTYASLKVEDLIFDEHLAVASKGKETTRKGYWAIEGDAIRFGTIDRVNNEQYGKEWRKKDFGLTDCAYNFFTGFSYCVTEPSMVGNGKITSHLIAGGYAVEPDDGKEGKRREVYNLVDLNSRTGEVKKVQIRHFDKKHGETIKGRFRKCVKLNDTTFAVIGALQPDDAGTLQLITMEETASREKEFVIRAEWHKGFAPESWLQGIAERRINDAQYQVAVIDNGGGVFCFEVDIGKNTISLCCKQEVPKGAPDLLTDILFEASSDDSRLIVACMNGGIYRVPWPTKIGDKYQCSDPEPMFINIDGLDVLNSTGFGEKGLSDIPELRYFGNM